MPPAPESDSRAEVAQPARKGAGGGLAIVLHAHLPYVRHPEHTSHLEEAWLFEAVADCYLPLLEVIDRLSADGVPGRLTISISPTLAAMAQDPHLQARTERYLAQRAELGRREVERTAGDPLAQSLAELYRTESEQKLAAFIRLNRDVTAGFAAAQARGAVDLATTSATHIYAPLHAHQPGVVAAQFRIAVDTHQRVFGEPPRAFWLSECGYAGGFDALLHEAAGDVPFVLDAHGLLLGDPTPRAGIVRPVRTPAGPPAVARDPESAEPVWDATHGYPGHPAYREFYRDIGFDLPMSQIAPFVEPDGTRRDTGYKYFAITSRRKGPKALYDPAQAQAQAVAHARAYIDARAARLARLRELIDAPPILTAPFDAELFGHWWYEGPRFLDAALRRAGEIGLPVLGLAEAAQGALQTVRPADSSWGRGGYHGWWLNEQTDWVYPRLHAANRRMIALATRFRGSPPGSPADRLLTQAARELLLAQASDWPFMIRAGTAVTYATNRLRDHLAAFDRMADLAAAAPDDRAGADRLLAARVANWNLFPSLDFRVFAADAGETRPVRQPASGNGAGTGRGPGPT
jgi:1,4-alpha-glucan branching enzyme